LLQKSSSSIIWGLYNRPEVAAVPRDFFFFFIWFVRLLALRPLLAYCASLGW
jgi:hypothetical protein